MFGKIVRTMQRDNLWLQFFFTLAFKGLIHSRLQREAELSPSQNKKIKLQKGKWYTVEGARSIMVSPVNVRIE